MTAARITQRPRVADVIEAYGHCLELVPVDPHFHNMSVGLYVKAGVCTLWTFSQRPGAQKRIETIRDQFVALGDMEPVAGTHNQVRFACGYVHVRPVKFLLRLAVGKAPNDVQARSEMSIKDPKSSLTLKVTGKEQDGKWRYQVSSAGEAPNPTLRVRMLVAGYIRYGDLEKVSDTEVAFPCGARHDALIRLLLPYARNISSVESMMAAEALRGQLTTATLGFTPT